MIWIIIFAAALILSALATIVIKKIALRFNIVDVPGDARKIHARPIPLLGGVGIFFALALIAFAYYILAPTSWPAIIDKQISVVQLTGIFLGAGWLVLGGILDDKYNLRAHRQIIWPLLAVITVSLSGIGITKITHPFGGIIDLAPLTSVTLTSLWLLGIIYTTKLLDGVDGLVTGITSIGAVIIAILSLLFFVNIPTAILATMIAGVYAGFLIFNFHPAQIFLGEAGSTLAGFLLGVLAIISGAKVATTVLVLGVPLFDMVWVITRRVFWEKKSMFSADRKHLHFRLLDMGLSQRAVVLIMYLFSAAFGVSALFLQSSGKLFAIGILLLIMVIAAIILTQKEKTTEK